jgi:hypothetical protein
MSHLDLYIEELRLQHVIPAHRERIRAAVERELQRLLAEQGLPPSLTQGWNFTPQENTTWEGVPGRTAESVGAQIAQQVYGGLAQGT